MRCVASSCPKDWLGFIWAVTCGRSGFAAHLKYRQHDAPSSSRPRPLKAGAPMGKRSKVRDAQPATTVHPDPTHQLTPRITCRRRTRRKASESRRLATPSLRTAYKVSRWPRARVRRTATRTPRSRLLHSRATPGRGEGKATCDAGCGAGQGGKRLQERQECQPEKECEEDDVRALSASPRRIFGRAGALRGGVSRGPTSCPRAQCPPGGALCWRLAVQDSRCLFPGSQELRVPLSVCAMWVSCVHTAVSNVGEGMSGVRGPRWSRCPRTSRRP